MVTTQPPEIHRGAQRLIHGKAKIDRIHMVPVNAFRSVPKAGEHWRRATSDAVEP